MPTLYTALSAGELATNPTVYGSFTHSFVLEKGDIVQIVVNNLDTGRHPFHLHGHHFQAVYRSEEDAGTFEDSGVTEADFAATPMRRDTLVLFPTGYIVLRFRADNPGEFTSRYGSSITCLWIPRCLAVPLPYRMARCIWPQ